MNNKILGIIFLLAGVLLFIGSTVVAYNTFNFLKTAQIAKGIVTKLNAGGSHLEVSFTTIEGEEISYPQNGLIFGFNVGDSVDVLYNDSSPREMVINNFSAIWGFNIIFIIMSLIFIIVGGFLIFS